MSKNILSTPFIKGAEFSPSNTQVLLNGLPILGWTNLSYSETATKENLYGGSSRQPIARGYANYEYEGSITLFASDVIALQDAARASGRVDGDPTSTGLSTMIIAYVPTEGQGLPGVDTLENLEFLVNMRDMSAGDTSIEVVIPFVFSHCSWGER